VAGIGHRIKSKDNRDKRVELLQNYAREVGWIWQQLTLKWPMITYRNTSIDSTWTQLCSYIPSAVFPQHQIPWLCRERGGLHPSEERQLDSECWWMYRCALPGSASIQRGFHKEGGGPDCGDRWVSRLYNAGFLILSAWQSKHVHLKVTSMPCLSLRAPSAWWVTPWTRGG